MPDGPQPERNERGDGAESRVAQREPLRVDPSCYAEAGRLQARCFTWEPQNGFPSAVMRAGDETIEFKPPVVEKHAPGVERVVRDGGKVEYVVHAGNDAAQNARWAQDAVRQAEKGGGGTVNLGEGTYRGNISVRGDNITIKGKEGKTVFDMGDKPVTPGNDAVFTLRGKNLTLDGVTIQNWQPHSDKGPVVGVDVAGGSEHVRLTNLDIRNLGSESSSGNKSGWGAHGIRVMTDGKEINDVVVQNAKLSNLKLGQHEAISFMAENGGIRNVKVLESNIQAIDNVGIVFEGSNRGQVTDFEVRGNRIADASSKRNATYREASAAGVQVDTNVVGGKIMGNTIEGSDHGIVLESEKGGAVRNIDISGNKFRNNSVAHVFADGSHRNGVAVDGARITHNQYTPDAPILAKDKSARIANVAERDNTKITESRPETRPARTETKAEQTILEDPKASMEQKAAAAARLHGSLPKDSNGRVKIKLKDGDKEREYEIEHQEVGKGIHVSAIFTKGEDGKDHPVLRWVDRRGKIEQQCDTKGSCVGFQSKYASEHMRESNIAKVAGTLSPPAEKEKEKPPREREKPVQPPREREKLPPIEPRPLPETEKAPRVVSQHASWATMYTPRRGEGGVFGNQPPRGEGQPVYLPNHTVQQFLRDPVKAGFAAAAGDPTTRGGGWGTMFRIPEMNNDQLIKQVTGMNKDQWLAKWGDAYRQKYGFDLTGIHFRVVDTGSAIKGHGRVDICVDRGTAHEAYIEKYNSPDIKRRMRTEVIDKRIRYVYGKA